MRKHPRLVVLSWNVYVANRPKRVRRVLRRWIRKYQPDIIVLNEARNVHGVLHRIPGYDLYQEQPVPKGRGVVNDRGDVAILVRHDHEVRHNRVIPMERHWTVFSHRRTHTPKRQQHVRVIVDGQAWKVRGEHWPTGGFRGGNEEAFLECAEHAKRFGERSRIPALIVGDLNDTKLPVRRFFGPDFKVAGHRIDLMVGSNVRRIRSKRLPKGGSDHYAELYTVTA